MFVVLGVATMLLYAVTAAWMATVRRRDPDRVFTSGGHAMRRRDVAAGEWIHRYVPWGIGGGFVPPVLGLLLMSRQG